MSVTVQQHKNFIGGEWTESDGGHALGDRRETVPEHRPELVGTRAELVRCDLVEHRTGGRAGDGVAAERPAEAARRRRVHDVCVAGQTGEWETAAERLPGNEQVRGDAVVVDRPDRPGAADAALHLVVDVEDPMPLADRLEGDGKVRRHDDEAALALHRLEHDARDRLRVDLAREEQLEPGDRLVGADAAVRVRRRRPVHLRRERAEPALVGDLRRHRHRQQRASVKCVVEDDDALPPRRGTGDLDGVLDRLRARVHEQRALLVAGAGRQLAEPPAHLHVRLVHADHEALVQIAVDLLVDRGDGGR